MPAVERLLRQAYQNAVEHLARPYVRNELPGWGLLYHGLVGSSRDDLWRSAGTRTLKDKLHGFELELDIATWSNRISYFLGRYYDLPTQLLLIRALRPGDHVFDVGANVGHVSLLMVSRVGESGRVDSFEPNPIVREQLSAAVTANGLRNLFVHGFALGTEEAELDGSAPKASPGEATFTPTPYAASEVDIFRARVRPGDAVVAEVGAPVLIKIDVEGFECAVLDGFERTLREHRPLVITEVMTDHLARAGETAATLFARMRRHGYEPLRLATHRRELRLETVTPEQIEYADVVWFDPNDRDHRDRLELPRPR